jgi:guanyl-specific ribonuclease Sa
LKLSFEVLRFGASQNMLQYHSGQYRRERARETRGKKERKWTRITRRGCGLIATLA